MYGSAADYLNQVSGYGLVSVDDNYHCTYAATHTSSSWISLSYGKKVQGMLMAGYIKSLGASKDLADYWFFSKDGGDFTKMSQAIRIVPTIVWNIGKFTLGLEYEMTAAEYGSDVDGKGRVLASGTEVNGTVASRHWVANHRVQFMTKFNF